MAEQERRESQEARRAAYVAFHQSLRHLHAALFRQYPELVSGEAGIAPPGELDEARRAVRDVYAEVQMIASDQVLEAGGSVVHRLAQVHRLLGQREDLARDQAGEHLLLASEALYEVRQIMRRDLGITEQPVQRPDGHGVF